MPPYPTVVEAAPDSVRYQVFASADVARPASVLNAAAQGHVANPLEVTTFLLDLVLDVVF
ncbi:MAG: hypothetical protein IPH30_11565 [Betaproteobacteria bacterium]|nr:hypothetical protein [Betaproteobacteria bacterium]